MESLESHQERLSRRTWCPRLPACPRSRRQSSRRAILRLTGIRPPVGTSSGGRVGKQACGRPWLVAMRSMGLDNARHMNPAYQDDAGVLAGISSGGGQFLWQDVAPRVERGLRVSVAFDDSKPYVEGNRLYHVTAECQLRSLDTQGFRDGANDGAYQMKCSGQRCVSSGSWTSVALGCLPARSY
jgi:hypothetical protein